MRSGQQEEPPTQTTPPLTQMPCSLALRETPSGTCPVTQAHFQPHDEQQPDEQESDGTGNCRGRRSCNTPHTTPGGYPPSLPGAEYRKHHYIVP